MVSAFADDTATDSTETTTDVTSDIESQLEEPVEWLQQVFQTLTGNTAVSTLLTATLVIACTAVLAHICTVLIKRLMDKEILKISNTSVLVNISRATIWVLGISVVLSSCFGINVTAIVTALGIGGIAVSLGAQDTIANLIGGVTVSILGVVKPGDYVTVGSCTGIVQDVTWRHTAIRDFTGTTYLIPNKSINTSTLAILPPSRKIKVPVYYTANPGKDLEELKKNMLIAIKNEVGKVAHVDKDPVFRFSAVTDYSFEGTVIIWVSSQPAFDIFDVQDAIVRAAAPFARAEGMRADLKRRPITRGTVKPVEGHQELVSADASMADEMLSEADFIKKPAGQGAGTAASTASGTAGAQASAPADDTPPQGTGQGAGDDRTTESQEPSQVQ